MAKNEIVKVDAGQFALVTQGQEIGEILRENLSGARIRPFDLDMVHVPSGGSTTWEVPTLDGTEGVKEIQGVIVGQKIVRGFWATSYDTNPGVPPICSSDNGEFGYGDPLGVGEASRHECATCKMNEWGSDPRGGKGKACGEKKLLFIMRQDDLVPIVVVAPPTSLGNIQSFFLRLGSKGIRYYHAVVGLALKAAQNGAGLKYSVIEPRFIEAVPEEFRGAYTKYVREFAPVISQVTVEQTVEKEAGEAVA